jgi:hypothetical protein
MPARLELCRIVVLVIVTSLSMAVPSRCAPRSADSTSTSGSTALPTSGVSDLARPDSIPSRDLITPETLGRLLAGPPAHRPALIHVGFKVLYRSGYIPGSRYAGPASKPEGLDSLKQALQPLKRDTPIVLYCGCCPWKNCPNVHPAYRKAQAMGFKHVQVLFITQDIQADWIDKGLPITESQQ